ncbi:MAG: hypothetical protein WD670_03750, partial [Actinomycetota bacterium]
MSQVNLLPPEVRQRITTRRLTIAIGVGGAAIVGLLILFWVVQGVRLQSVEDEITAQDATNAALQGQVDELLPFRELETELLAAEARLSSAMVNEVSWSGVMRDVQLVIPDQMAINDLSASSTDEGAPVEGGDAVVIGTISFAGDSEGTLRLARWVARQTEIRGWENPWV